MNGDPRDPLDDAIAADLGSFAPDDVDANAALAAMRPALRRARSRHRLAVSSGAVGAIVVVLGVGGMLAGRHPSHISVQQHSTSLSVAASTPSTRRVPTTTAPSTTSPTIPFVPPHSTSTSTPPGATPTTQGPGGASGPIAGSTTVPAPTSTTAAPNAPPLTRTYHSTGGSVTVTFENGSLTIDSYTPAAGYQAEVHTDTSDDVEVRFSNGSVEFRIRVRVESGQLTEETTEN